MRITRSGLLLLLIVGIGFSAGAQSSIDVTIDPPTFVFGDRLTDVGIDATELNNLLEATDPDSPIGSLTSDIENNDDLQRFSSLPQLALAAANAGSAASHLGTQRAFSDFRAFALIVGTGGAIATPGIDLSAIEGAVADLENEGDIYFGAAIQPITASLGVNLSRWIPRTRVNAKLGYANIAEGDLTDEISFSALSVGIGADYQLLKSRSLPLGFVRWRGLTLGSGFMYQRNETNLTVEVTEQAFRQELTYGDAGIDDPAILAGLTASENAILATLEVSPRLTAAIESKTYTIPLEVTTGLRVLWLLDVNLGAGVDLVFGESEMVFGADASVDVTPDPQADDYVSATPGSVGFGVTNTESPQFFRPRVTGGVGLNLGPIKLDVPLMLYFDQDGNTVMGGVNVGLVF